MTETAGWQFDIEVHPPGWAFPAGDTWLAGWIAAPDRRYVVDLRAWIDGRPFLALHGLPKPGMDEKFTGRAGPPYTGFVLRLAPHRGASLLRLEVRDTAGAWTELFRTAITAAPDAPPPPAPPALDENLEDLIPAVLRRHALYPAKPLAAFADELVSALLAVPLDTLPNPPFHGALEEPDAHGRVRYGRLTVTGWLAHRTAKIRRITALADPVQESPLLHGIARPDIGTVFADLPGQEHAQFAGHANLPPGFGGPALVKVFAELDNGEKHLAFAQRFNPRIVAGPEMPLPRLSRRAFARALWALAGAARRHGLPAGRWRTLLAASRRAWAAYRATAPVPPPPERPLPAGSTAAAPDRPLRILAVTHNLNFEGAPRLLLELSRYLARQPGHHVRVLSPQDGPLRALFEDAGMPVEIVDLSAALHVGAAAEFPAALAAAVRTDWRNTDLVLANTLVSYWAVHLAHAHGIPSLFYVHESAPVARFFGPLLPPALFPVVEAAFRQATGVVFTAAASAAVYARLADRPNFHVRPSWLDVAAIDAFAATHAKATLRRKHGLAPDAVIVLNLGTVCERKGQHTFVLAAALLEPELRARGGRPVEFVMVGARDDDYHALLRLQVAAAGLATVRFVPETRENFDWLRLADLLVCTSFEESSPRVLLEAAAFGLPIVTTNVNGIPELVTGAEAELVAPGDPFELGAALLRALAAHAAGDTTRAGRARGVVTDRFDERVSLPQHLALARAAAAAPP